MMKRLFRKLACAGLLTAALTLPAYGYTAGGGVVSEDNLNLREEAALDARIVDTIPKGSFVLVEDEAVGEWLRVSYNGESGYIPFRFVELSETLEGTYAFEASVKGEDVRMRAQPATTSQVLSWYKDGSPLTVEGVSGGWLKVSDGSGHKGYIRSDLVSYLRETEAAPEAEPQQAAMGLLVSAGEQAPAPPLGNAGDPGPLENRPAPEPAAAGEAPNAATGGIQSITPPPAGEAPKPDPAPAEGAPVVSGPAEGPKSDASVAEELVELAYQYIGSPYVYGGISPAGFDCSGFVNFIYNAKGYSLNRVANDIWLSDGESVARSDLKPGDILCFGYSGYCGHVGIYIGNGEFIHAGTSATGVILSDLSGGYYNNCYMGAKRLL